MRKLLEIYEDENHSWIDYFIAPNIDKNELITALRFVLMEVESGESKKKEKNL